MRLVKLHQDLRERQVWLSSPGKQFPWELLPAPHSWHPREKREPWNPVTLALPWEERREGRKAVLIKE